MEGSVWKVALSRFLHMKKKSIGKDGVKAAAKRADNNMGEYYE
jgi:hypothetical protein